MRCQLINKKLGLFFLKKNEKLILLLAMISQIATRMHEYVEPNNLSFQTNQITLIFCCCCYHILWRHRIQSLFFSRKKITFFRKSQSQFYKPEIDHDRADWRDRQTYRTALVDANAKHNFFKKPLLLLFCFNNDNKIGNVYEHCSDIRHALCVMRSFVISRIGFQHLTKQSIRFDTFSEILR